MFARYPRPAYLEELVCEGVDQLQVDGPEAGGGEELPQHPLRDAPPPAGQPLSFYKLLMHVSLKPMSRLKLHFLFKGTWY